jgi:hypothetical protein
MLVFLILLAAAPAAAQDYGAWAATVMRAHLKDPTSVMQAERTPPFQARVAFRKQVVVCVRLNARNSFGGYTGTQTHSVVFYHDGDVVLFPQTDAGCDRAGWVPFTELTPRAY